MRLLVEKEVTLAIVVELGPNLSNVFGVSGSELTQRTLAVATLIAAPYLVSYVSPLSISKRCADIRL